MGTHGGPELPYFHYYAGITLTGNHPPGTPRLLQGLWWMGLGMLI